MSAAFWPVVVVGALFVWIVYVAVDLEVPAFLAKWYREPGNSFRALTWVGSLFIVLITLASPADSLLGNLRTDAITVAATVIVIEELGRYRARLEEKERLIRQMASHSNDFALEAVRQIVENGWDRDGSLCRRYFSGANLERVNLYKANLERTNFQFANLRNSQLRKANLESAVLQFANLQKSFLREANLKGAYLNSTDLTGADFRGASLQAADLNGANLTGADLEGVNLEVARYTVRTIWPDGFDYESAGAILVEWDNLKREWVRVKEATKQ